MGVEGELDWLEVCLGICNDLLESLLIVVDDFGALARLVGWTQVVSVDFVQAGVDVEH